MNRKVKYLVSAALISVFIMVGSCSRVPVTGRKQVSLMPESQLISMSITNYSDFISKNTLSTDKASTKMVKEVGIRISNAVKEFLKEEHSENLLDGYKWEYNLIEEDVPNAWCMPGGKIVFYTGILPFTKDATGIAVVMGHEVAHAIARHGNERMSHQIALQYGAQALNSFISDKPEESKMLYQQAFGLGAQYGIMLPYSRLHESEADKMGLIFMAKAGYDPREAIKFWERMSNSGGQKPPEIMSTHPSDQTRIEDLKKFMPEALKYYKAK